MGLASVDLCLTFWQAFCLVSSLDTLDFGTRWQLCGLVLLWLATQGTFNFAKDCREAMYSWSPFFLLDSPATFRAKIYHANEVVASLTKSYYTDALCLAYPDSIPTCACLWPNFDPTLTPVDLLLKLSTDESCGVSWRIRGLSFGTYFSPAMCTQQHVQKPGCAAQGEMTFFWTFKQWSEQKTEQSRAKK